MQPTKQQIINDNKNLRLLLIMSSLLIMGIVNYGYITNWIGLPFILLNFGYMLYWQITQKQIEKLKGKCPHCINGPIQGVDCHICQGSGKATIEIEKEWVKCPKCRNLHYGKGKIQKYQVNEIIYYCEQCKGIVQICTHKKEWVHKLKIISETEDKWRVCLA